MKKVKFRYNENEYTLRVMGDDWELEDGPSDMSERLMDKCREIAIENGMLLPVEICPSCRSSNTISITEDYTLESVAKLNGESFTISNITRTKCPKCEDEFFTMPECEKIEAAIKAECEMRNKQ